MSSVQILVLPLVSCVTLRKSLTFSVQSSQSHISWKRTFASLVAQNLSLLAPSFPGIPNLSFSHFLILHSLSQILICFFSPRFAFTLGFPRGVNDAVMAFLLLLTGVFSSVCLRLCLTQISCVLTYFNLFFS